MIVRALVIFLIALCGATWSQGQTNPPRTMAVTIDDLPFVNPGGAAYVPNGQRATVSILSALGAHSAPAIGFVIESRLHAPGEVDQRIALLQRWVDAGMTLGNHTYSHPNFNDLTSEQFQDEIIKGEVTTRRLMEAREPYQLYFRHPMTHTGDTRQKKEAIEEFVASRGYRIAPHTIENADYIFNVPYAQALQNGDSALVERLLESYLDYTLAVAEFAERISVEIFGREVAQTLLVHANDITADSLDTMLARFEERGYRFITLDAAMSDPAYSNKDTLVTTHGPTWLFRWMKSMGKNVRFRGDPEPPSWVVDLYWAARRGTR
jgi:peptidoglycan/xylan/chitin deacetylase (PgdA/CDA1 family)